MVGKFIYYLKIYGLFVVKNIKSRAVYSFDHLLGLIFNIVIQGVNISFLWVLFSQTTDIGEWKKSEVLFLYAFVAVVLSLSELFFATLYYLPTHYIRTGELDRLLVKPLNSFFVVLADRTEIQGLGTLIVALCVMGYALNHGIVLTPSQIGILFILVILSILLNLALFVIAASLGFWLKNFTGGLDFLYVVNEYIKYPFIIFPKLLFNFFVVIFPVSFIGYVPVSFLLGKESAGLIGWMPVVVVLFNIIAFLIWKSGLKGYTSAGC